HVAQTTPTHINHVYKDVMNIAARWYSTCTQPVNQSMGWLTIWLLTTPSWRWNNVPFRCLFTIRTRVGPWPSG
ncbi:MAG: hypothetical protein QGG48_13130, partial [Desulfatiglandales bacterium]|nr:hypothetical protein [Desulfatiglandales bacterium]